jgi:hypothetical protein
MAARYNKRGTPTRRAYDRAAALPGGRVCRPLRGLKLRSMPSIPGLTPMGYFLPPASAGSGTADRTLQ